MDAAIAVALHLGIATVERVRKRFVEEGLEVALCERPRPGAQRKLDSKQEAFLIALACSPPPRGTHVVDDAITRRSTHRTPGDRRHLR
jgi:putative transposase